MLTYLDFGRDNEGLATAAFLSALALTLLDVTFLITLVRDGFVFFLETTNFLGGMGVMIDYLYY
jgi:hypothetical protein